MVFRRFHGLGSGQAPREADRIVDQDGKVLRADAYGLALILDVQDRDLIRGPAAGHALRSYLAHGSPSVGYLAPDCLGPSTYGRGPRQANIGHAPGPGGHAGWRIPRRAPED